MNPNPASGYTVVIGPAWSVPSSSAKNLTYTVTVDQATGLYICGCKDHEYRRRDCRHIKQVQAGTAGKPRIRVQPKPATSQSEQFDVDALFGDGGAAIERSLVSHRAAVSA